MFTGEKIYLRNQVKWVNNTEEDLLVIWIPHPHKKLNF